MNNAPLDVNGYPETDSKIIIQALIDQMNIVPKYNKVTDTTTFNVEFPLWMNKNYSNETVKQLVTHITPTIEKVISEELNKKCLNVSVEGVKGMS